VPEKKQDASDHDCQKADEDRIQGRGMPADPKLLEDRPQRKLELRQRRPREAAADPHVLEVREVADATSIEVDKPGETAAAHLPGAVSGQGNAEARLRLQPKFFVLRGLVRDQEQEPLRCQLRGRLLQFPPDTRGLAGPQDHQFCTLHQVWHGFLPLLFLDIEPCGAQAG
jgi:hypothetical protein